MSQKKQKEREFFLFLKYWVTNSPRKARGTKLILDSEEKRKRNSCVGKFDLFYGIITYLRFKECQNSGKKWPIPHAQDFRPAKMPKSFTI